MCVKVDYIYNQSVQASLLDDASELHPPPHFKVHYQGELIYIHPVVREGACNLYRLYKHPSPCMTSQNPHGIRWPNLEHVFKKYIRLDVCSNLKLQLSWVFFVVICAYNNMFKNINLCSVTELVCTQLHKTEEIDLLYDSVLKPMYTLQNTLLLT